MSAAIAIGRQMVGADLLKLRKKRSTLIWALVLVAAPVLIYFIVRISQHSSNPHLYEPAGGAHGFSDALRILGVFGGPLAAILIGVEAGAGDRAAGVFRDLIVTGRSRVALFATRVPAAIMLTWALVAGAYVLVLIGTFAFAAGSPTPPSSTLLDGFGFALLSSGVLCAVAVGFASLTGSRPAALVALIGWQLIAEPVLSRVESLGSVRKGFISPAIEHFSPVSLGAGPHSVSVAMAQSTAIVVMVVWVLVFLVLGAWRTRTMDA